MTVYLLDTNHASALLDGVVAIRERQWQRLWTDSQVGCDKHNNVVIYVVEAI